MTDTRIRSSRARCATAMGGPTMANLISRLHSADTQPQMSRRGFLFHDCRLVLALAFRSVERRDEPCIARGTPVTPQMADTFGAVNWYWIRC